MESTLSFFCLLRACAAVERVPFETVHRSNALRGGDDIPVHLAIDCEPQRMSHALCDKSIPTVAVDPFVFQSAVYIYVLCIVSVYQYEILGWMVVICLSVALRSPVQGGAPPWTLDSWDGLHYPLQTLSAGVGRAS